MDKLGVYAPTLVGIAAIAYISLLARRIKREQARSRDVGAPAQ